MASRYPSGNYGNGGGGASKENGNANKDNGNAKDNVFDLDSAVFASDQFRMHEFKVKRCPRARPHDWTQCPFAHPGEKARRRDPRRYKYSGTACPEFRKSGCCRRGDACPFAHGVFECWLHPSRYRTQLCTDGTNCKRRVCFFAHVESELRHPEDDPGVAQKQVQAELAAEVQTLQQQHFTQALQALLLQTTNPVTSPERQPNQLPALTLEMLKQNPQVAATEMMTDPATDSSNSTAALQLVLLQQLAAKEQQFQQNMGDKASDVPTSEVDTSLVAVTQGNNNGIQHQPDVYDALSQLKQLSLSATAPVSSTSPAVGPSFDASALLSQMLPNGGTTPGGADLNSHPLLINSLLNQNAMKIGPDTNGGQPRRSIDNSYLSTLITDGSLHAFGSSMGFPAVTLQNGGYMTAGTNGISQDASTAAATAAAAAVAAAPVQIPTASNGMYPAVSNGVPAMYSMENIQRLLQNPAFSSNLSQLFQMNPALLQQLTANSAESGNPVRHSIDNAYLTRLNTDMNRLVDNGGVKGITTGEQITPPQPEPLMNGFSTAPQNHDSEKLLNGAIVSEALLQELNALKLQLGSSISTSTTMSGDNQIESNGYPSFPPHSSPDSDGPTTSCGPPTNSEQGHTEDSN